VTCEAAEKSGQMPERGIWGWLYDALLGSGEPVEPPLPIDVGNLDGQAGGARCSPCTYSCFLELLPCCHLHFQPCSSKSNTYSPHLCAAPQPVSMPCPSLLSSSSTPSLIRGSKRWERMKTITTLEAVHQEELSFRMPWTRAMWPRSSYPKAQRRKRGRACALVRSAQALPI